MDQPRIVRCPICIDTFPWPDAERYEYSGGDYRPVTIPAGADPLKRADLLRFTYVRCPNPSEDMHEHYLPAGLGSFGPGLVVGLVGASATGKSHLLAAIVHEVLRGGLQPHGLSVTPVDPEQHAQYLGRVKGLFVRDGRPLPMTTAGEPGYAASMLVTSAVGTRPVTFFDVAGGDLEGTGKTARFLAGVGALLFVVDPGPALGQNGPGPKTLRNQTADSAFTAVFSRLRHDYARYLEIPTAVAVTKSDRLRFQPPVDRWLHRESLVPLDPDHVRQESRDVYAFLHRHGAYSWLAPFQQARRCTLHFVSATGGELVDGRYPRGASPRRVLEPLLALLAMNGMLGSSEADHVGVWRR